MSKRPEPTARLVHVPCGRLCPKHYRPGWACPYCAKKKREASEKRRRK